MSSLDTKLFYAINGLAGKSGFWDQIFIFASIYAIAIFSVILAINFFKNRKVFWLALFSAILSRVIFTEVIRYFYHRSRPFDALENVIRLGPANLIYRIKNGEASFPSGHAAFMFAIAFAVYLYNKKVGAIFILVALFLSVARIYVGVHYPSDILGGIAVAGISVYLVKKLSHRLSL